MFIKLLFLVLISGFSGAYLPSTPGGDQNELPKNLENVGIDEKLDTALPGEVELTDDRGQKVLISSYYNDRRPIIISPVYYSCPSLCNLHLKGVFEVFSELGLKAGKDFEFLAISIDAREDADLAAAKKENYLSEFLPGVDPQAGGIHFMTGTEEQIKKITDAVGFKFQWDAQANEWAHASAAIISTPQGQISRYLHGVYFEPKTFRLSVIEASKGMIGTFADNFALFCFRYDPKGNKYSFYIMNILRGFAALVLLILLAWLAQFWWKSNKTV